jgi:diguanylate cyclase
VNTSNPIEIARETLRMLALRRITPTPENYQKLYHEIAGTVAASGAVVALEALTDDLRQRHPVLSPYLDEMDKAIRQENWPQCARSLIELAKKLHHCSNGPGAQDSGQATEKLVFIQDLLAQTLEQALAPRLEQIPALAAEARHLAAQFKASATEFPPEKLAQALKRLWVDIEIQSSLFQDHQEKLRGLLQLLIENIGELLDDESWLGGQLAMIKEMIQSPAQPRMFEEAEKKLKEVIYKQGMVKSSLKEATNTLKATMKSFVDKLGEAVQTTGDYQEKISGFAERISNTEDVLELNSMLEHILRETRVVHASASRTHDELKQRRDVAISAERRIEELESELIHMSTLVRIDPMTQSLNRRGMEHEFQKEAARADRNGSPLSVAMIDIDNFKKLNDTYGHMTGDEVLIHLVQVAKEELRVTDVIGRMGGEEFLILLPNTNLEDAVKTIARVQRGLTRRLFLNDNNRILITFSGGVALRERGENQESAMNRADKGLYEAKRTGKNKVCMGPPLPAAASSAAA